MFDLQSWSHRVVSDFLYSKILSPVFLLTHSFTSLPGADILKRDFVPHTSPTYFWTSSDPMTRIKHASVLLATALAQRVFPVPGGPNKRTPLGGSMPRFTNRSGYEKKHWQINTEQLDHKDNAYMNFKVGKFCLQCLTSSPPKTMLKTTTWNFFWLSTLQWVGRRNSNAFFKRKPAFFSNFSGKTEIIG